MSHCGLDPTGTTLARDVRTPLRTRDEWLVALTRDVGGSPAIGYRDLA
jgi:hypothetical protein